MAMQPFSDSSSCALQFAPRVDEVNSGVVFLNHCLEMTAYNQLALQLFEAPLKIGDKTLLHECLSPAREEYKFLTQLLAAGKVLRDFVATWEIDGQIHYLLFDTFAQSDAHGRFLGLFFIFKDLSNFTALEHNLQNSNRLAAFGKIAAGVAHEIRNPLTTIKGFLQVLERNFEAKALSDELHYANVMLGEIAKVDGLVDELLFLARPHRVEKIDCSLASILDELHPQIELEAAGANSVYHCHTAGDLTMVADAALVKHLIMQLTKNALEAMETGGTLSITAKRAGHFVQLDISDTGPGIPYYLVDKIFDVFYTTKESSTGLGLPICQRIAADHGGEIRVSSKGFGTTFSVILPVGRVTPSSADSAQF